VKILLLAPHPFFQARGTPLAVRTVLEFLSGRGHHVDILTLHEGEDLAIPASGTCAPASRSRKSCATR
jgi:hypothetical protein